MTTRATPIILVTIALALACAKQAPAPKAAKPATAMPEASKPAKSLKATPTKAKETTPAAAKPAPKPAEPAEPTKKMGPGEVAAEMAALVKAGKTAELSVHFSEQMKRRFPRLRDKEAKNLFNGKLGDAVINGGVAVVKREGAARPAALMFFEEGGAWKFDYGMSMRWAEAKPGPKVPENKPLKLSEVTKGIPGMGSKLVAVITSSAGEFRCALLPDAAPETVANFVGLARGLRGWQDPKTKKWQKKAFFDGLVFHRVIPKFMIQGGCPLGKGTAGPGYTIPDEFKSGLVFDEPGLLAMANSGPNTNGSQFFITEIPTPWLNYRHTIFGRCEPAGLVKTVAAKGAGQNKVRIESVTFLRQ